MEMLLQPQLNNSDEIKQILKQIPKTFKLSDGRQVKTLLVYLPCQMDNQSSHNEFFECIKNGILHHFVLSCSEIERKLGIHSEKAKEELFQKALRKISQHTAKGELGELILFTLLDVYFSAPKLLSKIATKTSTRMPVFGADAVHGQFMKGELIIYLGESKLYGKFKSAASVATESITNAKAHFNNEFDLLDSAIDFPNLNVELAEKILEILNPYKSKVFLEKIHSPCFIGFTQPDIIFKNESEYLNKYEAQALEYIHDFFNKVENQGLEIDKVTLMMLPFTCVDELVKEFISYFGVQE